MWVTIKRKQRVTCPGCDKEVTLSENESYINVDYINSGFAYLHCTCTYKFDIDFLSKNGSSVVSNPKLNRTQYQVRECSNKANELQLN